MAAVQDEIRAGMQRTVRSWFTPSDISGDVDLFRVFAFVADALAEKRIASDETWQESFFESMTKDELDLINNLAAHEAVKLAAYFVDSRMAFEGDVTIRDKTMDLQVALSLPTICALVVAAKSMTNSMGDIDTYSVEFLEDELDIYRTLLQYCKDAAIPVSKSNPDDQACYAGMTSGPLAVGRQYMEKVQERVIDLLQAAVDAANAASARLGMKTKVGVGRASKLDLH